jgi:hypothetical protein
VGERVIRIGGGGALEQPDRFEDALDGGDVLQLLPRPPQHVEREHVADRPGGVNRFLHARAARGRVERPEIGDVAARLEFDPDRIGRPGALIIFAETPPEAAGVHPDDGVDARVEIGAALANFHAEDGFFEGRLVAGQGPLDREGEEPRQPLGFLKCGAREDARQLRADRRFGNAARGVNAVRFAGDLRRHKGVTEGLPIFP